VYIRDGNIDNNVRIEWYPLQPGSHKIIGKRNMNFDMITIMTAIYMILGGNSMFSHGELIAEF